MTVRILGANHLGPGATVKLGRRRPTARGPRLRLRTYLKILSDIQAPSSCDYSGAASLVLSDIYGNDQLGDCVIAGGYHVVGTETGNAGDLFHATLAQIISDYSAIGGYKSGDPSTDNGCDEQTALNYWTQTGFANGTKLAGWAALDASDQQEVMAACYLFENLFFGIELPDAWISPMPSGPGFTWDAAGDPNPNNGHCIMGVGYTTSGILIDTWGMIGTLTWAALAEYVAAATSGGELYVMLSPDQLAKGQTKAPNGVAWSDLLADLSVLNGSAPAPAPQPTPPVPQYVTLEQAKAWSGAGLEACWPKDQK